MKLRMATATGCVVLMLGGWSAASQSGAPAPSPTSTPSGVNGGGGPNGHGTTDKAGQTPQPIGTGGTAVEQGKGGAGRPTNDTSDKKGKRKPRHSGGPTSKDVGFAATAQNTTASASTTTTDHLSVHVIGCVQRTPATAADNTTTVVPDGETRYVLSNVTLAAHDALGGGDRHTAGDVLAEAVNLYRLDDAADSMIAPHVGDRVEVSGTVAPQPAGTSGRTALNAAKGPLLKVEHIERVSEGSTTCVR